jgi:hypothetical protein
MTNMSAPRGNAGLYQAVLEACPDSAFADRVSKRSLVKMCKQIAYGT